MRWLSTRSLTWFLLVASLGAAFLRMFVTTPGGLRLGSMHEAGAFMGGVVGAFLMPWAIAGLVVYGHWLWWKSRAKAEEMKGLYPDRKRFWLNLTVIVLTVLMAAEAIWIVMSHTDA